MCSLDTGGNCKGVSGTRSSSNDGRFSKAGIALCVKVLLELNGTVGRQSEN